MKRILTFALLMIVLALGVGISLAQTDTTTTEATSSVTIFFVACENQGVINLNGNMEAGLDVYFQFFSGPQGGGTALTTLRQAQVDGTYAISDAVPFQTGSTVAAGATASARVFIAREGSPSSTASDIFLVDDIQDGCNNPQNALTSSVDTGTGAAATTTSSSHGIRIRSPFGGFISPPGAAASATPEPAVVIGARQSAGAGNRSNTAGVLFAECDKFPSAAAPGTLFDNDNIIIFWSWYARTEAQVQDHISKAQYNVRLNSAPLIEVQVSPIEKRGTNFWVFYYATVGNLRPGGYGVEFDLSWSEAHFDGYRNYGPGTDRERERGTCTFRIDRNPNNLNVSYNNIYSVR